MNKPLMSFRITKHFRGFSLECEATLEAGITAVWGPSGSGKTTLLSCIAGLITPDDGEIEAFGRTIYSSSSHKNVPAEKRRFGYVFQDAALFPHMSVRDNIMYGYRLTHKKARKIDLEQLIEVFQISSLMDRRVTHLSGGERQLVALARALAISPDLLLLDEPLASLDPSLRGIIIESLNRVWQDLHTSMIYVSHSISEVMALAETTLVLSSGKRIVQGKTSDVLVHPQVVDIDNYPVLENLLEAVVVSGNTEEQMAELAVGDVHLLTREVHGDPGDKLMISIRSADIILALDIPRKMSARNVISAKINEIHPLGHRVLIFADIGIRVMVEITRSAQEELDLKQGQGIYLIIKTNSIFIMDAWNR